MNRDEAHSRIIFPLDVATQKEAWGWCSTLKNKVGVMKVGLQWYTAHGPAALEPARAYGYKIMLDLKLHDIPNTVGQAAQVAHEMGVDFLTVHASGGFHMMRHAVDAARGTKVLAVTVLTSMEDEAIRTVFNQTPGDVSYVVKKLADMAYEAGARGFVCSPLEVKTLKDHFADDSVTFVIPGVRPAGASVDDQKRVATPGETIKNGADYLVVGRPIRKADDPVAAADLIAKEMADATGPMTL